MRIYQIQLELMVYIIKLHSYEGDVVFIDTKEDSDNTIVIEGSKISSTGTISIYSDIVLEGDTTITSSKCISAYNNSRIIIDLTERSKDEVEVLTYNCVNIPVLDIALTGSFSDGCIPRYEVKQTSLILIFDTASCQTEGNQDEFLVPVIILVSVVTLLIVVGVILIVVFTNDKIRTNIFHNRTKAEINEVEMAAIDEKMKCVDAQIASTTALVEKLNNVLDEN